MDIKSLIPVTPDWPSTGVNFLDIGGILKQPAASKYCVDLMRDQLLALRATSVVAIESRGFLFATAAAYQCDLPVFMARKAGKLPGNCVSLGYDTEYSQDTIQMQRNCDLGARPVIVDDLLATGGTVLAVAKLIRSHWPAESVAALTVINLAFLPGAQKLQQANIDLRYLVEYHA
jgi:adenine phosphoribosyltransferase